MIVEFRFAAENIQAFLTGIIASASIADLIETDVEDDVHV
jgi:hypothetical protein